MPPDELAFDPERFAALPEDQRAALEGALRQYQEAIALNPLNAYVPHDKQKEFHGATTQKRAFVGGNRSGKTTAGVADDLIQLLDAGMIPPHLRPYKKLPTPCKIRVVTPDLQQTMESVLEKYRKMVPKFALKKGSWEKGFDKTKRILAFENGSQVDFMSTQQDLDQFAGVDRHRIHYDEPPRGPHSKAIWSENDARLLDHNGDEIWTMTPIVSEMWVYELLWENRAHNPSLTTIQVDMDDNPHLDEEGKAQRIAGWSEEERRMRKSGEFMVLKDLFYPEFTDSLHVVPTPDPGHVKEQSIVVGIDPGLRTTGVVWVAFDNDNAGLVFTELYPKELVVADVARLIHAKNERWGISPDYYVIDPSARNRNPQTGENIESEYMRHGIFAALGQNERGAGILEIKARLQAKDAAGNPRPGLLVAESCKNLRWEIQRYRRDEKSHDEFAAVKEHDHLADALRYVCMSRTWNVTTPSPERPPDFSNPMVEPPWRDQPKPVNSPPLGAF